MAQVTRAEQRLSDELSAGLTQGTAVRLGEPEQAFLGIYQQAQGKKSHGGVILLHDINNHADWPDTIAPLRQNLPHHGWHTLSIQLPAISASQAAGEDTTQWSDLEQEIQRRIQVAIDYCHERRIFNIVLLGHQFGALMAGRFVGNSASNSGENKPVSALVVLNLYSPVNRMWMDGAINLELASNIKIAFLDIVPGQSGPHVLELAKQRKAAMLQTGHDKYKQIHIIGTDYTFRGAESTLLSRIHSWLTKIAPSMEVQMSPAQQPSAAQ